LSVRCNEEDVGTPSVSFETGRQSLKEGSEALINLDLKHPATQEYLLKIKVETNAIYGEHFVTEPALDVDGSISLIIANGRKSIGFKVRSFNNDLFDGGKFMILSISSSMSVLTPGEVTTNTITIADDEGPSLVDIEYVHART
jgi:hypothetical protein